MSEILRPSISADHERANIRHLYAELAWMSVPFAMEWYYLGVYAIFLGATAVHLAMLTSGRALLLALGSGLAHRWQRRYPNAIRAMAAPLFMSRLLIYLGIALVPFLPHHQVDALIGLALLSAVPGGICQGVFLGMVPVAVGKKALARVVARRSMLLNLTVLICVLVLGQLLERIPKPGNYQIGFALGFIASLISWWHIQRIRTPDSAPAALETRSVNVWQYAPFRRLALIVVAINASVFMAVPLIPLQLIKGLNATDSWISFFGMFEMVAGALLTIRMGWLIQRVGTRRLIIATTLATVFQVLILALTTSLPPYIFGELLFGAGWFAVNVLLYNRLVEITPPEDMRQFAATYQVLINAALFIGPLAGTFLIENGLSVPSALLLITGLRLAAGLLAWIIRVEPEPQVAARAQEAVQAV